MKRSSYTLIAAVAIGAAAWVESSFGQDAPVGGQAQQGADASLPDEALVGANAEITPENAVNDILRPVNRLVERAMANIDRLPAELQVEVSALQEAMTELQAAWESDFKPGAGATVEELIQAREQFRLEYQEQIQEANALRKTVMQELRANIRERLREENLGEGAHRALRQYRRLQAELAVSWRAALSALGENPTPEEVAEARRAFLEANAEVIAQQKELALQIREMVRGSGAGAGEGPRAERPELPQALQDLKAEMQIARSELQQLKASVRAEMATMTQEERETRRRQLLDELRAKHEEVKNQRRQLIEELQDVENGDRRPED